jgi:hypothetical protein
LEKPIKQSLDQEGLITAKVQESLDGFISIHLQIKVKTGIDNLVNKHKITTISPRKYSYIFHSRYLPYTHERTFV